MSEILTSYLGSRLLGRLISIAYWGRRVTVERVSIDTGVLSSTVYRNGRKVQ